MRQRADQVPARGRFRGALASLVTPLTLAAAIGALGWLGTPLARRPVPEPAPVELWIEPELLAAEPLLEGVDPRWDDELRATLAALPAFRADDAGALADLAAELAALAFVADVPVCTVDAIRGLELELALREPVACVPVAAGFLTVDAEGVLLPGEWPAPTRVAGAPLAVLGPMEDARGLFKGARPGDWLVEPEHLDALDVALSLREHLTAGEQRALGRVVVDARRAAHASVAEPGVRLALEDHRLVLFGRSPSTDEPGELAVGQKWDALRRALVLKGDPRSDWEVVDVRWDRPELVLRSPELASAAGATGANGAGDVAPRPR